MPTYHYLVLRYIVFRNLSVTLSNQRFRRQISSAASAWSGLPGLGLGGGRGGGIQLVGDFPRIPGEPAPPSGLLPGPASQIVSLPPSAIWLSWRFPARPGRTPQRPSALTGWAWQVPGNGRGQEQPWTRANGSSTMRCPPARTGCRWPAAAEPISAFATQYDGLCGGQGR